MPVRFNVTKRVVAPVIATARRATATARPVSQQILDIMHVHYEMTGDQIAKRLKITKNTATRALRHLRAIGVNVTCQYKNGKYWYRAA